MLKERLAVNEPLPFSAAKPQGAAPKLSTAAYGLSNMCQFIRILSVIFSLNAWREHIYVHSRLLQHLRGPWYENLKQKGVLGEHPLFFFGEFFSDTLLAVLARKELLSTKGRLTF